MLYILGIYTYEKEFIWAQGGVSISLGNTKWEDIAKGENYGFYLNLPNWYSAMVADSDCNVYLIVTHSKVLPSEFRNAIQKHFNITDGNSNGMMGIFLDGSTCAQLKCKEKDLTDSRPIMTAIILENK